MKLSLKTAPAVEPITISEAKLQLHMDSDVSAEDTLLTSLIVAARRHVEFFTGRALVTQTWYAYLDDFPNSGTIELPLGGLQSVTSVKYKESDGTETTMTATSEYLVDTESDPGRVVLPYLISWPSFTPYPYNAVTIEFVCGYGLASSVPDDLKAVIKLIVGDLYANREQRILSNFKYVENATVYNLLAPYRMRSYF